MGKWGKWDSCVEGREWRRYGLVKFVGKFLIVGITVREAREVKFLEKSEGN